MKKFIVIFAAIIVLAVLGRDLLPNGTMFTFHDETQAARISEFTFDLMHGQIPPRIAPHFSFGLGYPVFNFYAPFAYWATSLIHVLGFTIADSIKFSFFLALLAAFTGMYFFLKLFFRTIPSLMGATLYLTSPYMAVEIFVRGNLSESWFIALLPWVLFVLYNNVHKNTSKYFVSSVVLISFLLTVHNILSLLTLLILLIYILLLPCKKKNFIALAIAFLLSAYYLIPALGESYLTYASEAAKRTHYADHFLCWFQLWTTPYFGFGGSEPGCFKDGMSFMLGKIQILVSIVGILFYSFKLYTKKFKFQKIDLIVLLFIVVTIVSLVMTTYSSAFIWDLFSPILALFQFPWRFLALALFGPALLGAYVVSISKHRYWNIFLVLFMISIVVYNAKFFTKSAISLSDYDKTYLSDSYIHNSVVYKVAEYLPRTADYDTWLDLASHPQKMQDAKLNQPFLLNESNNTINKIDEYNATVQTTSQHIIINKHYFPFWSISIDGLKYTPHTFDALGRPLLDLGSARHTISIALHQTLLEQIANLITIITTFILFMLVFNISLWKRFQKLLS